MKTPTIQLAACQANHRYECVEKRKLDDRIEFYLVCLNCGVGKRMVFMDETDKPISG